MNDRVIKNPNFKNNGEFHQSLASRGVGAKDFPNSHTEVEYLDNGKFGASIGVGHQVFFDKADGNKPKKHKLTDERPSKDYVLIQGAKCCVEVHPYYAKYFDVQHEEVRLYEERWVVQRLFKEPDTWRDVGAYNPQITVDEYPEPAGDVVKATVTYDTDYGPFVVEYFQRDGNALKHNVTFNNTSGPTETFRVLQRWAGIVGAKVNGKDFPVDTDEPFLAFRKADKKLGIAENLSSMVFNPDGSEKTDQRLQRPIRIEAHAQGMKADFVYGNWTLAQDESLEIDPDTATISPPTEDGYTKKSGENSGACSTASPTRLNTGDGLWLGGIVFVPNGDNTFAYRAYMEWDISGLLSGITITDTVFKYSSSHPLASDEEINPITEEAPSGATDANLWDYIGSGTAYVDPFNLEFGSNKEVDLGALADADLQTAVDAERSWFAIGVQSPDDECAGDYVSIDSEEDTGAAPKPTLYVEYTPAVGLENKSGNIAAKMVEAGLI